MYDYSNKKLTPRARILRRTMTEEERKLWYTCLRLMPWKFRKQKVISKYVVDFYCTEKKVAIEVDGSQHFEGENIKRDKERTEFLNSFGITVLRYTNKEVNEQFRAVCDDIYARLSQM